MAIDLPEGWRIDRLPLRKDFSRQRPDPARVDGVRCRLVDDDGATVLEQEYRNDASLTLGKALTLTADDFEREVVRYFREQADG